MSWFRKTQLDVSGHGEHYDGLLGDGDPADGVADHSEHSDGSVGMSGEGDWSDDLDSLPCFPERLKG